MNKENNWISQKMSAKNLEFLPSETLSHRSGMRVLPRIVSTPRNSASEPFQELHDTDVKTEFTQ